MMTLFATPFDDSPPFHAADALTLRRCDASDAADFRQRHCALPPLIFAFSLRAALPDAAYAAERRYAAIDCIFAGCRHAIIRWFHDITPHTPYHITPAPRR